MRLLLLLSAFLTALVGAGGERASAAPVQAVAMASVAATQAGEREAAHRSIQTAVVSLADVRAASLGSALSLKTASSIYKSRLRI